MAKYDSDDRHLHPDSGVLVNLLGITDQAELNGLMDKTQYDEFVKTLG